MKARIALATTVAAAAVVAGGIVLSGPASAVETTMCGRYDNTKVQDGDYIVQNNVWGTADTQCIDVIDDGFTITQQDGVNSGGAPTAYPSMVWGCHYANCTNDFSPIRADSEAFAGVGSQVTMDYVSGGVWNASYDLWFDPTARTDGQNTGAEMMIWLNTSGGASPTGSKVGTVSTAGGDWDVWYGNSGWNVISYVRTTAASSIDFQVSDFYDDAVQRGYAQDSWYLTSIQAGFEPWSGGKGLGLSDFAVTTDGGTSPDTATPTAATPTASATTVTPTTTASTPADTGSTDCTADLAVTQSWNSGFLAEVTVTNTGEDALTGWTVDWAWPGDQTLASSWNAGATQSGSAVSASSLSYNSTVAAGASTGFGMQVGGSAATPELTCTAS